MAFGFGFNKQKALNAAEKYVQQGKLQNAIAEYEKVTKADPKDLTVTNTIGDLYSRLGEADKATECFKTVGDAYATQGFTVKAIAMYKKISKLKPSLESVLKLAELYTQQGLFNDARAQYLQVAEEFLKAGELDNAVRIFQKILEMDPENTAMRIRLAEVYIRLGKKNDAWQIFSAAAETLRSKGSLSGAEEVLQRMLTLDPGNSYALLMQGRNQLEAGDADAAVESLRKVSDLDSNPDGLRDLLRAYLKTGRLSDAGTLAAKLLSVHNDLASISTFTDALMQAGQYENALQVYDQHAERMLAEDSEKVIKNLRSIIGHVRDNPASLEKLLDLFQKAGDSTHITEVIELLAHASVQSGDLPRARDLYQKLAALEPGNPLHLNHYQQVVSQLGGESAGKFISAEEAAVIVDELEATAPSVHQHYSDAVALAVRSALTDAELFISYNMPAKALGPLTLALRQAPNDLRLNQRLAALHTRSARFAEAAVCCLTLQGIYSDAGYPEEATRYGELAGRYEDRNSGSAVAAAPGLQPTGAPADTPPEERLAPINEPAPWPAAQSQAAEETEFAIVADHDSTPVNDSAPSAAESHSPAEIDLSSEWDDDSITIECEAEPEGVTPEIEISDEVAAPAAAPTGTRFEEEVGDAKIKETIEEVRFYLEHGMPEQATGAFDKLQSFTHDESILLPLEAEIRNAAAQHTAAPDELSQVESVSEFASDVEPAAEFAVDESPAPAAEAAAEPVADAAPEVNAGPCGAGTPARELSPRSPQIVSQPGVLQEFVSDLESSLGDNLLPGTISHEAASAPEHAPAETSLQPVAEAAPATTAAHQTGLMGEFVADIEASLGEDFLKGAPVAEHPSAPAAPESTPLAASAAAAASSAGSSSFSPAPVAQQSAAAAPQPNTSPLTPGSAAVAKSSPFGEEPGVDLAEMFGELKQDLESGTTTADEDPETHYNLGIAFREMGLLDEAIGELQKTCQAVDRGHPFPQVMQTYTWLAQCFLDKGVPEAAIRWYEKALQVPAIDEETRTALHYELAAAQESAGDKPSALKNFMEVYGRNIDYRDVAERIKALKS
jgi:tetratricopeptide (TPR) repeat protein